MMTLDATKWNGTGGELSSCVINTSIRSCIIIFGTLSDKFTSWLFILFSFMYLYICLCFLCFVICMHSFHSAHIFKVCNSVIWPNYGHIVKLYSHFVYSPLNSYVYIHWIWDFKYILLLLFLLHLQQIRQRTEETVDNCVARIKLKTKKCGKIRTELQMYICDMNQFSGTCWRSLKL